MKRRGQRGMSVVEVLAAMVIFSAGAVVLFDWIGQVADRMSRLAAEQRELFVKLAMLEYAKTINPMREPEGSVDLADGVTVRWTSELAGGQERRRNDVSGIYEVGLYRVELAARRVGGVTTQSSVYLAGWRQLREVSRSNPFSKAPP